MMDNIDLENVMASMAKRIVDAQEKGMLDGIQFCLHLLSACEDKYPSGRMYAVYLENKIAQMRREMVVEIEK